MRKIRSATNQKHVALNHMMMLTLHTMFGQEHVSCVLQLMLKKSKTLLIFRPSHFINLLCNFISDRPSLFFSIIKNRAI